MFVLVYALIKHASLAELLETVTRQDNELSNVAEDINNANRNLEEAKGVIRSQNKRIKELESAVEEITWKRRH